MSNSTPAQPNNTPKHPGGRPTKYDPSFVQKSIDYIAAVESKEYKTLPTVEGFARYLGVDTDQINRWSKAKVKDENGMPTKELKYPEFCGAVKRLKSIQKNQLINDGLYGGKEVNTIMAIFLLKANHKMVETSRTDVDLTSKGESLGRVVGFTVLPPEGEDGSYNPTDQTKS